jgi:hypothetical protein
MNINREKSFDKGKGVYVKRSSKIILKIEKQKLGTVDQSKIIMNKNCIIHII